MFPVFVEASAPFRWAVGGYLMLGDVIQSSLLELTVISPDGFSSCTI